MRNVAGGTEPEHPGHSRVNLSADLLQGAITPDGVFSVITGGLLGSFLLFPHGGQLFFRAEAGIGHALLHQLFGINVVNVRPLPLIIGAICAAVTVCGGALIKLNAVMLQRFNQHLYRTGNLPLGIGVLHPQEQNAAALMGHTLGGQALDQIAQMDKTGGGGGHAGDDGALGYISGRKFLLQLLRRHGDIGKKKFCQCLLIHNNYLFWMI